MKTQNKISWLIFLLLVTVPFILVQAQSDISVYGQKINHLDRKKRKQGEWIFFDRQGFVRMSCSFKDDICVSPQFFYENSDTAFVRFPLRGLVEDFILFEKGVRYVGSFVHSAGTATIAEVDSDTTLNDSLIRKIKKYQDIVIEPSYLFGQRKLRDYISASFTSANLVINKPLNILLTVNGSGNVTKVEFPDGETYLSGNEEREVYWIYSTMPRWQPMFYRDKVIPCKILLSTNSTLSAFSFDR